MPKRLDAVWESVSLKPTALTIKLLNLQEAEESGKEKSAPKNNLSIEEIIYQKKFLQDNWNQINSDKLIESIDGLLYARTTAEPQKSDHTGGELWLLKALAQEKSFFLKPEQISETYLFCVRGKFLLSLVYNNLGVIEANLQKCFSALDMFKEAILADKDNQEKAAAPYYNFFSIIQHLKENNFLSFDNGKGQYVYKEIISRLHYELFPDKSPKEKRKPSGNSNMQPTPLTDDEVLEMSRAILRYSSMSRKTSAPNFFSDKFLYLVPKVELLNSFGDIWNRERHEIAERYFEIGNAYLREGKYGHAIESFEIAKKTNSSIEIKIDAAIEQAKSLWQVTRNSEIITALRDSKYELAENLVKAPIDDKLKLGTDDEVAENIRKIKINNLINEIEKQNVGRELSAPEKENLLLRYLELLQKEEDLTPAQKEYISWRIVQISE